MKSEIQNTDEPGLPLLMFVAGLCFLSYVSVSTLTAGSASEVYFYLGFALTVSGFLLRHISINKNKYFFDLTWPEYKKEGYSREEWESMRDSPENRILLENENENVKEDAGGKRKKTRIDCGKVISITVERGGVISGPISQINTDKGAYRVRGDVGSVKKGELASIRGDLFYLGVVSEKRKFTLIK